MSLGISRVVFESRTTAFHYDNAGDHIQGFHQRGIFYEARQLEAHRDIIPMQSTVLDVGANIGNHTLFYAMHTWAGVVYPFEPNRVARELLLSSLRENSDYRARTNLDYVSHAVGREAGELSMVPGTSNNLGATSFDKPSPNDPLAVKCVRLDDLAFEGQISFIKIDVEGMEFDVLAGATQLIARFRPSLAVEISARHEPLFWAWLQANQYQVVNVFFEYLNFKNYLIIPIGSAPCV